MHRVLALVRVKLVNQRVRGDDAVARAVPPDDLFARVHLLVELDHRAVELHVHVHGVVLLVVRDRVAVSDVHDAVHADAAEQRADDAVLRLRAADEGIARVEHDDGVNPSAGHLAGAGDGEERDHEGCRVASVPAFGGVERAGDGARGVRACGRVRPEEGERRRRGGAKGGHRRVEAAVGCFFLQSHDERSFTV